MTAACTLARLDRELTARTAGAADRAAAELYLRMANRRFDQALHDLDSQRRSPDQRSRRGRASCVRPVLNVAEGHSQTLPRVAGEFLHARPEKTSYVTVGWPARDRAWDDG